MASRRMVDPAIWQSETFAAYTYRQRVLFIGLFSNADDQGRLRAHPALIRSLVFPYEDITLAEIDADLQAIAEAGGIHLYEMGGHSALQVIKWWDYQKPQWAYASKITPPDGWHDRLRFRKDNEVHTDNWSDPLPNIIGKGEPSPQPSKDSIDQGSLGIGSRDSLALADVAHPDSEPEPAQPEPQPEKTAPPPVPQELTPGPEPPKPAPTLTQQEVAAYLANPDPVLAEHWTQIMLEVAGQVTRGTYEQRISSLQPLTIRDGTAVLCHPTAPGADWCRVKLRTIMPRTVGGILHQPVRVAFTVGGT